MGVNIRLAFQIDKKKPNNNYDGQDSFQYFASFILDGLRHDIRGLWMRLGISISIVLY